MIDFLRPERVLDRPFVWHGIAFITGIGLGLKLGLPFEALFLLGITAMILGVVAAKRKMPRLFLVVSLAVGVLWSAGGFRDPLPLPYQSKADLEIRGMALSNAVLNESGVYHFYLDPETVNGQAYRGGKLLIYGDDAKEISYGSLLIIKGEVLSPRRFNNANSFDYQKYLLQNNISGIVSAAYGGEITVVSTGNGHILFRLAARVEKNLDLAFDRLPSHQAELLKGIFFGDVSGLDKAERNILIESGIMHAFAVSGMNIAYILIFVVLIAGSSRKRRWLRLVLGGLMLAFYLSLVGFGPSVLRAAVMAFIALWAVTLDEKPDPYVSLAAAAVLLLLWRPVLLFNAGFQLSFIATFGIFYLGPVFAKVLPHKPLWQKWIAPTFGPAWAVMPLAAYYFHIVSFSGWLASPLLLLVIGLVIVISFGVAVIAIFSPFLAAIPLYAAGLMMEAVYQGSYYLSRLPLSWMVVGTPGVAVMAVYYLLLLFLPLLAKKLSRPPLLLLILALVFLIVLPLDREKNADKAVLSGPDIMEVDFLDVGQGDCALIITPEGKTILIDGGGNDLDDSDRWVGENILLPYLRSQGIGSVDFIISSHPHADHISGLITVLTELPVKYYLTSALFAADPNQEKALALCGENGVRVVYLDKGDRYPLTPSVSMEVFAPDQVKNRGQDLNDQSLVLKLSYGEMDFLFAGDIEAAGLAGLGDSDIGAEVLKIPHHGSANSYDEDFYRAVDPRAVTISVGRDNSYGHPYYKIIDYWRKENVPLYRTDKDGEITFLTDGYQLETVTEQ